MEHSYSRDCRPIDGANGLKTRTLMIHRPPQCPSCHLHPNEESNDLDETNRPPTPTYNEKNAKELMTECFRIASSVQNTNPDDINWENCVNMTSWTNDQVNFFNKIVKILDIDHLGRLATAGKQNEAIQKRLIIDKSVKRMRKIFAKINWDMRLTQWLHETLINNLPPTYMAIYLDILQTLKTKLPQLMDKMLFGKPMNISQDLLAPVMKKKWEIVLDKKERKLPGNVAIIVISSSQQPAATISNRMRNWYELFATMAQVVLVNTPNGSSVNKQPLQQVTESLIYATKTKIQELKNEQPNLNIVLLGFNSGASVAIQVAYTENVNCVVCMGFACNTVNGIRGAPDDHILEIVTPIMFVVGQNSARTSQEEIEALREKMKSETSLLIIGSADDVLRISKSKKQIENLTQSMVDSMVTDEIHEFVKSCICKPPGPRQPTSLIGNSFPQGSHQNKKSNSNSSGNTNSNQNRKRKFSEDRYVDEQGAPLKKHYHKTGQVGRPRTRPINNVTPIKQQSRRQSPEPTSTEKLNMALHTLLQSPRSDESKTKSNNDTDHSNNFEQVTTPQPSNPNYSKISITSAPQVTTISTTGTCSILQRNNTQLQSTKLKLVPSNQFVQLKPPIQSQSKIYTIKTTSMSSNSPQNITNIIPASSPRTSITSTSGQVQLLPIKTSNANQFLNNSASNQIILNPQKFTIAKTSTNAQEKTDISNIFDMPILFADSDGNLHDSTTKLPNSTGSVTGNQTKLLTLPSNLVIKPRTPNLQQCNASKESANTINSPQLSSGTFVLNPSTINKPKISGGSGKVVFINRNTMKPYPSILSKPAVPSMKYTKVVVTNPQTSTASLVSRATGVSETNNILSSGVLQGTTISVSTKQQQQGSNNSNIVKQIQPTSGILNCTTTAATASTTTNKQYQVLLNLGDSSGTKTTQSPVKNVIKMDSSPINQTILLKTGNTVKHMPLIKTTATPINKNLSIKKVMNFIPSGGIVGNNTGNTNSGTNERISSSGDENVISTITFPRTGLVVQPITSTSVSNLIINKNQKKFSFNVNDANVKNAK